MYQKKQTMEREKNQMDVKQLTHKIVGNVANMAHIDGLERKQTPGVL